MITDKDRMSISTPELPPAYLLKKTYYSCNNDNSYVEMSEAMYRRRLKLAGVLNVDVVLEKIAQENMIDIATPLAGWPAGFQINNGVRCLVTRGPNIITPVKGNWDTIQKLLDNIFRSQQLPYFKGWLQCMMIRLRDQVPVPIQAVALIGKPNSGKNRIQSWLITPLSGGTVANPYQFMVNGTGFNEDLGGATHLMLADENSYQARSIRDRIGDYVRQLPVNEAQRIHPKGQKPNQLVVMSVLSISCNLEPRDLLVIPPLEHNVRDRLHLFYAYLAPMPIDTSTLAGKKEFKARIMEELPAFAYHLLEEWETPKTIADPGSRFPTATWHHSTLVERLSWVSAEGQYRELTHSVLRARESLRLVKAEDNGIWKGTSAELQALLCDKEYNLKEHVLRLAASPRQAAEHLSKLQHQYPREFAITKTKSMGRKRWLISHKGKLDLKKVRLNQY